MRAKLSIAVKCSKCPAFVRLDHDVDGPDAKDAETAREVVAAILARARAACKCKPPT